MNVKQLLDRINKLQKEIGCDGNGNINSHKIGSRITIDVEDSDEFYELADIELDYLPGCGCPCGITLIIKKQ